MYLKEQISSLEVVMSYCVRSSLYIYMCIQFICKLYEDTIICTCLHHMYMFAPHICIFVHKYVYMYNTYV